MVMIRYKTGNLLEDQVDALVNTVNTVGVMGKGIALQFKQAFPDVFREYEKESKKGNVQVGKMQVVPTNALVGPNYIINFPTKKHWKEKSKMIYVEEGLKDLVQVVRKLEIESIAIPPLGCGNGGLNWLEVKPIIEKAFADESIVVHIYEPSGSPKPDKMKIGTTKPRMTKSRALMLASMHDYSIPGYRLSLLEEVGEPLKLNFEKNKYGPYAENLNFVLQRLDGHFIRGYGDRNRNAEIYLLEDSGEKAYDFLKEETESIDRLSMLQEIIRGFETPYGMELLATVHWIMRRNQTAIKDVDILIKEVQNWNQRKKEIFEPKHIEKVSNHFRKLELPFNSLI
jgi:O-acetyl-ADP-ribose deacetylase (regulator of RNase III)